MISQNMTKIVLGTKLIVLSKVKVESCDKKVYIIGNVVHVFHLIWISILVISIYDKNSLEN